RSSDRRRSATRRPHRRGGGPPRAQTDGAAWSQRRGAPRGRGCPGRAAAPPVAPGTRRKCRGWHLLSPPEIPLPHDFEQLVVGEVHVERGDGDVAITHCLK